MFKIYILNKQPKYKTFIEEGDTSNGKVRGLP